MTPMQALIVDDNETMREAMAQILARLPISVVQAADGESALAALAERPFDLVVTDYRLPGMNGLQVLQEIKARCPATEVLVITAYGTIDLAVQAMHYGAADFITKPFSQEEFRLRIQKMVQKILGDRHMEQPADAAGRPAQEMDPNHPFAEIIGESECMHELYRTLAKVARTDSSVILYGESGVGKEVVARAIHAASDRSAHAFIRVHCGALAEGVLESELFGHEKGAFTGALKRKRGRFELAHNGSIFLDEIGDISASTQIKLLRVLQEREFERVGGEETITVNVRVIAATHRDLEKLVHQGRFREDLYYRLHIIPIFLPPLRDRREDIPLLSAHFLRRIGRQLGRPDLKLEDSALAALYDYAWPGNVRELENVLERAAVMAETDSITAGDLPVPASVNRAEAKAPLDDLLARVEREEIEKALRRANGVKTEAARLLGIKTSTLYYKMEKYGLS
ncbi:MAG: Transcriptional regulatory protein ZraR [bacterium ADurb.Bin478]|nr:MAG: Transcriptional regulatory protein ZraR [bacterium ADurb.Bin478]